MRSGEGRGAAGGRRWQTRECDGARPGPPGVELLVVGAEARSGGEDGRDTTQANCHPRRHATRANCHPSTISSTPAMARSLFVSYLLYGSICFLYPLRADARRPSRGQGGGCAQNRVCPNTRLRQHDRTARPTHSAAGGLVHLSRRCSDADGRIIPAPPSDRQSRSEADQSLVYCPMLQCHLDRRVPTTGALQRILDLKVSFERVGAELAGLFRAV
ncbi:unnamed protein product [Cutaneotrichosporon oleaginosum]